MYNLSCSNSFVAQFHFYSYLSTCNIRYGSPIITPPPSLHPFDPLARVLIMYFIRYTVSHIPNSSCSSTLSRLVHADSPSPLHSTYRLLLLR